MNRWTAFVLSAAAGTILGASCGNLPGTGPTLGEPCSSDASCDTGELCHPTSKVCVATCDTGADCSAAQTCSAVGSGKVCTCASDNSCAAGEVCQPWSVCTDECTSNSDCPSTFTCNTTTGKCSAGGGTDGGVDGGVACSSTNFQPDVCGYGQACNSANRCDAIANLTTSNCANITQSSFPGWNASTSTGPVIFNHTYDRAQDAGCADTTNVPFNVTLFAYSPTANTFSGNPVGTWPNLTYYRTDGSTLNVWTNLAGNVNNAFSGTTTQNNGRNASVKFTLCPPAGTTSLTAGFAFTNGNAYCATMTR